jgi:lysophospholipase L1-like esterase
MTISTTKAQNSSASIAYHAASQYRDVPMKLTAILLTAIFAISGCGGGSQMTQERQIAPSVSPAVRISAPISNVAAFMGDSITFHWDLTQYDAGPALNFGFGLDTTVGMLARFPQVIAAAPGVVVILGGVNDLHDFGPSGANTDSIKAMAEMAKAAGIRVIVCSVMPPTDSELAALNFALTDVEAFNNSLIELAQANGYLYADYYDAFLSPDGTGNSSLYVDGLHPNAAGYAKMWAVIAPLLAEDLN